MNLQVLASFLIANTVLFPVNRIRFVRQEKMHGCLGREEDDPPTDGKDLWHRTVIVQLNGRHRHEGDGADVIPTAPGLGSEADAGRHVHDLLPRRYAPTAPSMVTARQVEQLERNEAPTVFLAFASPPLRLAPDDARLGTPVRPRVVRLVRQRVAGVVEGRREGQVVFRDVDALAAAWGELEEDREEDGDADLELHVDVDIE